MLVKIKAEVGDTVIFRKERSSSRFKYGQEVKVFSINRIRNAGKVINTYILTSGNRYEDDNMYFEDEFDTISETKKLQKNEIEELII